MIFRPYFWHSLGAFCIAEKGGDERREGRIAADPSRTSSFWRFAVRLSRQSERARGGWLIGAAASKTKPTASANFNECNQKNRFGRLSGPNGDRSRSILTKEWVEIIRGQMSMRDQKLITPLRPRPPVQVRSPIGFGLNGRTHVVRIVVQGATRSLYLCRCVKAALLKLWQVRLPNMQPLKKATAPATSCAI